ncbi:MULTISPECIES: NAD(P)-dependent oxidoreductase [unclassified Pseudoclavibacter]|uniref:NAD(P)-dependent oxidoreductase n=1 Tax=unclassified Pseudoclavibacter TaxID=2615177 RepID=UPI0012EF2701|nr:MULTISPECIES: NAD(P)H-binding protein [unclassified Pseudoclavibacter]MBF4460086.1 NAD(P)H-binding protein [Pseudoclavibacter sp. VKM Ac-2867]VXC02402.1 NAD-dependent epimerase [Pseudoclavibacter sp. 8L]
MAKITILGGTGYAGSHLVRAAAAAGHEVTSFSRSRPAEPIHGVSYVNGSVLEDGTLEHAIDGAEVIVSALAPRGELEGSTRGLLAKAAELAASKGVRFGVIGGAGSLFVAEGGPRLFDTEGFPDAVKPEASEMAGVLDDLRASAPELDWFYVSPAAAFGAWAPGEATGEYRIGGDVLLTDANGDSNISGADFAAAIVAEIDTPTHRRARFGVAY